MKQINNFFLKEPKTKITFNLNKTDNVLICLEAVRCPLLT